ncbi:hypothetical protein [Mangrovicoccus ximenensis]|uniref:hypothetical protein n=1 Tax=Mangrovicoccus ximenensis TaxID=1911570 RepID=UPI000D39F858|nr:hypothetical protein [Mangrovicoccus ximenensis]
MTGHFSDDRLAQVVARLADRLRPDDHEALRAAEEEARSDLAAAAPDLSAADVQRLAKLALDRAEDALGCRIPRARRKPAPAQGLRQRPECRNRKGRR